MQLNVKPFRTNLSEDDGRQDICWPLNSRELESVQTSTTNWNSGTYHYAYHLSPLLYVTNSIYNEYIKQIITLYIQLIIIELF